MKPCSCCLEARRMPLHADSSYPCTVFLGGDDHQRLFQCLPSAHSLFFAPNKGLVDLCAASEPFAARPHHRAPQLVQQRPGGAVASQTQNALQSQSTRPGFLARHPTTSPDTRCAAADAYPGKSCPPSAKPDNRIVHSAAGPADDWARARCPPQRGHAKPRGQRSCIRYSRHACSVTKRPSNSSSVRG